MGIFTVSGRNYDSNIFVIIGKIPSVIDTGTGFNSGEVIEIIKKFTDSYNKTNNFNA